MIGIRHLIAALVLLTLVFGPRSGLGEESESGLSLEDLRAFADAWSYVKRHYVEPVDDRSLLDAAIAGMLGSLDSHSRWLSADDFENLERQTIGRYGGLGIQVSATQSYLQVDSVFENGPARDSGLEPGDRITAINRTVLTEDNIEEAAGLLRGAPGSRVEITVERDGLNESMELSIIRQLVHRHSLSSKWLNDRYIHLSIERFQQTTANELDDLLDRFEAEQRRPAGILLDLRGNPGGVLQMAVAICDRFLSDKLVVTAVGRDPDDVTEFRTSDGQRLSDVPMVVLVDGRSASAAEIVAAALRDHGRALVVGETTYGKGSVQTVWALRDGSGIRLTTAHYYTPAGDRIQAQGIRPDVHSESDKAIAGHDDDMVDLGAGLAATGVWIDEIELTDSMLSDAVRVLTGMVRMQIARERDEEILY